ncbi:MAG: TetR/AcrR family transcriptional regulator [Sulfurovum sp.]|nr:TetR/AcrR family transcriptional regulator [Sulfurovum sp.]
MKKQPTREKLLDITFEEVYIHGYNATSVDAILKKAGVPKGSMYHHFKGKKELVLAMVQERLFPKMDMFFKYEVKEGSSVYDSLKFTLLTVSRNKMLVTYGCPLYRLMVELSATDKEFDALLSTKATQMKDGITSLLQSGQASGEFIDALDTDTFAAYMLNAVWGILSVSPSLSSSKQFLKQSNYILKELKTYKLD